MNLPLPTFRNSFHPAWLLLLLAPLLGLLASDVNGMGVFVLSVRLALVVAFVGSLLWWRHADAPPGLLQSLKELRGQLPGCLIAMGLPGLLFLMRWVGAIPEGSLELLLVGAFSLGCLLMGATAFGSEFELRTMAPLLSQPGSRASLFFRKMGLLGALLLAAWLNLALDLGTMKTWDPTVVWQLGILALGVFFTTPLFTLITRSTLAGGIFTIAVPALGAAAISLAVQIHVRVLGVAPPDRWFEVGAWVGIPLYLLIGAWLGWRQFARLQVQDAGGGHGGFHPLSVPIDRLIASIMPDGWLGQLVRKEQRLHVVPWLVSGMMVGLWTLLMLTRMMATGEDTVRFLKDPQLPMMLAGIMGALIVLVSGSACVAEERQLGTLDWQLTQPLTFRRQWLVKIAVAMALALGCGVLLPVALLRIAFGAGLISFTPDSGWKLAIAIYAGVILLIHILAIYASSFSRSTMKATAAAIGLGVGVWVALLPVFAFMNWRVDSLLGGVTQLADEVRMVAPSWVPGQDLTQALAIAFGGGLVVAILSVLLFLGSRNFRGGTISRGALTRQFALLALLILVPALVLAEAFGQLLALNHRATMVGVQAELLRHDRQVLLETLTQQSAMGVVDAELLQQLRLDPSSSPQIITDTLLQNSNPREVHQWAEALIRWKSSLAQTKAVGPAASSGSFYRLDPGLARRYGLTPADPKAKTAAPPPSTPPK